MNSKILWAYYSLKPFIPRRAQIFLRNHLAKRKIKDLDNWPIDGKAGDSPKNWPGWPDSKKFAFVLTHDVERQVGLEKCLPLMEVVKKHGFRSSFNFVPHGYVVPPELRKRLKISGFEVGVHGLRHHGNIFRNRAYFDRISSEINKYLKEWGAVGFRAPSMFHNLDWIRNLDIEYDSSTFDTDPFEPQPDGVRTIFPFSVNGNGSRLGYIELPYTLPQDFLLFIILRHNNIDVWKKKLDWVAERGGMVNMIVHPDYINFGKTSPSFEEYPVRYIEELLNYVKHRYAGRYWHALPRDVAKFYRELM